VYNSPTQMCTMAVSTLPFHKLINKYKIPIFTRVLPVFQFENVSRLKIFQHRLKLEGTKYKKKNFWCQT